MVAPTTEKRAVQAALRQGSLCAWMMFKDGIKQVKFPHKDPDVTTKQQTWKNEEKNNAFDKISLHIKFPDTNVMVTHILSSCGKKHFKFGLETIFKNSVCFPLL